MKLIEILESLSKHKEHYRVLPDKARAELAGLMGALEQAIDEENRKKYAAPQVSHNPVTSGVVPKKRRGRPRKVAADGVASGTEED